MSVLKRIPSSIIRQLILDRYYRILPYLSDQFPAEGRIGTVVDGALSGVDRLVLSDLQSIIDLH